MMYWVFVDKDIDNNYLVTLSMTFFFVKSDICSHGKIFIQDNIINVLYKCYTNIKEKNKRKRGKKWDIQKKRTEII